MKPSDLEQLILNHVFLPTYKPVKPKYLAAKIGLGKDDVAEVKKMVKRLVRRGRLEYGSNHLVRPASPKSTANLVTGIFQRNDKGFGFVRPSKASPRTAAGAPDVFIPPRKTMDASTGDLVVARLSKAVDRGGEKRLSGMVIEILERETHQFVGTYREENGIGLVDVDGNVFNQAIFVGDAGAKGAKTNDKVVLEMVRFPSHAHEGEGVIIEVLGERGQPGVDTLSIIREFNLPDDFPEEVLEESRQRAEEFDESIGEGRRDLTGEVIITIDPFDARDFDDAISLRRIENGHWLLGVHIADVSHFVQAGSKLDQEARERATSVYLPDRVIPMLPEIISNNLASLQPERVRYSKTVFIEFTPEGARVRTETCSGAIKSRRRFTYEEVDDYLARPKVWQKKLDTEVFDLLGRMHELAMMLRGRRMERGSIELVMPEVKIDLDDDGRVAGAHLVENTESHQIIEEFMLAANEAVAEMLADEEIVFLRRIHSSPDPRKLKALTQFVQLLDIECESLESRFEIKRVLAEVSGRPEERAVNYAVLRSFQKAVYGPDDEGHFALASANYCHFTSPIRRYPDLTIHRLLESFWRNDPPEQQLDVLVTLGEHCSDREQRAEQAERELKKVKLLDYVKQRIGERMEGVITGVEKFGIFVQGVQLPAEGLVHIRTLTDDHYYYEEASRSLMGSRRGNRFRLGDIVLVEVAHVDVERRELDFKFIERLASAQPPKKKPKRKPTTRRGRKKAAVSAEGSARGTRQTKKKRAAKERTAKNKAVKKKSTKKAADSGARKKPPATREK